MPIFMVISLYDSFLCGLFKYSKLKGFKKLIGKWHTQAVNADTDKLLEFIVEVGLLVAVILKEKSQLFE